MNVDLRIITHFEAVYRLGSFSHAAEELHLSHSAVTKSIKSLEEKWDTLLFFRTTRKVEPTDAGRRLYNGSLTLLALAESVKQETQQSAGELKIACGSTIFESWVEPAVIAFREAHPSERLSVEVLSLASGIEKLKDRRSDLVIYHRSPMSAVTIDEQIQDHEIFTEPGVLVCKRGHPVMTGGQTSDDLLKYDWVVAPYEALYEDNLPATLRAAMNKAGFPKYRLISQNACIEMARKTDVLAIAPLSVVSEDSRQGVLDFVPNFFNNLFMFSTHVAMLKGSTALSPKNNFLKILREMVPQHSE